MPAKRGLGAGQGCLFPSALEGRRPAEPGACVCERGIGVGLGAGPRTQPSMFPRSAAGGLDLGASGGLSSSDTTLVLLDQMHPEPRRRGGHSQGEEGLPPRAGGSWGLVQAGI